MKTAARGGVTALTPQRYPTSAEKKRPKTWREAPFLGRLEEAADVLFRNAEGYDIAAVVYLGARVRWD